MYVNSSKHIVKVIPDSLLANLNKAALFFLWRSFSICMFYDATFYIKVSHSYLYMYYNTSRPKPKENPNKNIQFIKIPLRPQYN